MGHEGGDWLERPEREAEEQPRVLLENMNLGAMDVVADIGAGTGYFSFRIAPLVPQGKVLAEDIQPEMLDVVRNRSTAQGIKNIEPVLGTTADVKLPQNSLDVVLLVDAYHEFDHPREMMQSIVRALKPGGRVVQVEYRGEDPAVPIKPLHKMTEAQAKREMAAAGLVYVETKNALPRQHILIFRKQG
jgi:ubiquinone/menaquinone biosynthesis C-methylase UbiE